MSLTPKNWNSFQHYKDRSPAWIKLHRGLLDDFAFSRLPVASRALAPLLWLLASEYEGGSITATFEEIAFRLRTSAAELRTALKPLIDAGFFLDSAALADCKHGSSLEKEGEKQVEKEEEERQNRARADDWPSDYREQFWAKYPHKVGKSDALNKLDRIRRRAVLVSWFDLMAGLQSYIRDKPPDRQWCNPATWLNQDRWTDQPSNVSAFNGKTENRGGIASALDKLIDRAEADGSGGFEGGKTTARLLSHG